MRESTSSWLKALCIENLSSQATRAQVRSVVGYNFERETEHATGGVSYGYTDMHAG